MSIWLKKIFELGCGASWRKKGITSFPKTVFQRIPNFVGAEKAAQNLKELPEYKAAKDAFCRNEE